MSKFIKIFSHPRSGTHFLGAFLSRNFYPNENLSSGQPIYYGHWSDKIYLEEGEPFQKLYGGHQFPQDTSFYPKMIYIFRDGRSVIASLWNSNFYNKDWKGITFSEFLRKEIDWYGGPGQKKSSKMNIIEHWYQHTDNWLQIEDKNLLFIQYEQLKKDPDKEFKRIQKKFFPARYIKDCLLQSYKLDPVKDKIGLRPNSATINGWEKLFSEEDLKFFYSQLPSRKYLFE